MYAGCAGYHVCVSTMFSCMCACWRRQVCVLFYFIFLCTVLWRRPNIEHALYALCITTTTTRNTANKITYTEMKFSKLSGALSLSLLLLLLLFPYWREKKLRCRLLQMLTLFSLYLCLLLFFFNNLKFQENVVGFVPLYLYASDMSPFMSLRYFILSKFTHFSLSP